MPPRIELKYDEARDSFYIDCGPLDSARHVLNLIMYALEKSERPNKSASADPHAPDNAAKCRAAMW